MRQARNLPSTPKMGVRAFAPHQTTFNVNLQSDQEESFSNPMESRNSKEDDQEHIYCEIDSPAGNSGGFESAQNAKSDAFSEFASGFALDENPGSHLRNRRAGLILSEASPRDPKVLVWPHPVDGQGFTGSSKGLKASVSGPQLSGPLKPIRKSSGVGYFHGNPTESCLKRSESSRFARQVGGDPGKPPIGPNWVQRNRVGDSQIRFIGRDKLESSDFESANPAWPGLGPRSKTQTEITLGPRSKIQSEVSVANQKEHKQLIRFQENPPGHDLMPQRRMDERPVVNLGAVSRNVIEDMDLEANMKGFVWVQKSKAFSRWKERFFVVTKEYMECFKKTKSVVTEIGKSMFRINLCEIDELDLVVKNGYLTISLSTLKTGKLLLRKVDGARRWYQNIQGFVADCKEKLEEIEKTELELRKQVSVGKESRLQPIKLPRATYRIDPIPTIPEPKFGNLMMRNVPDDGFERKYYGFIDGPNKAMVQNRRGTSCRGLSFELKQIEERGGADNPTLSTKLPRKFMSKPTVAFSAEC